MTDHDSVFHITSKESHPPGENPMRVDYENMGTRLGQNVMVLHKNFMHDVMEWMVLVHIPSGQKIMITFPEDRDRMRLLTLDDAMHRLDGDQVYKIPYREYERKTV